MEGYRQCRDIESGGYRQYRDIDSGGYRWRRDIQCREKDSGEIYNIGI